MRIAEFSARTGLPPSTLRYYERQGLLAAPARRCGKRDYDPAEIFAVRLLSAARGAGFSIADLRALMAAKDNVARAEMIERRIRRMDEAVTEMQRQQVWLRAASLCDCASLSACGLIAPL